MASIRRRAGRFQARIIRKGNPPLAKTFRTQAAAQQWAELTERQLADGTAALPSPRRRLTLLEALDRYEAEVTPQKRGAEAERGRIAAWKRHALAHRFLDTVRGADLARHRDARLAAGRSGDTVRLVILWEAADRLCGKRLKALIPMLVDAMRDMDT